MSSIRKWYNTRFCHDLLFCQVLSIGPQEYHTTLDSCPFCGAVFLFGLDFTGSASLALSYFLLFFLIRLLVLQAISVTSFIYVFLDLKKFLEICFHIQSTISCSLPYLKFLFITIYIQFLARIYSLYVSMSTYWYHLPLNLLFMKVILWQHILLLGVYWPLLHGVLQKRFL